MPKSQLTTAGIDHLVEVAESLADLDFQPLMMEWEEVLDEDNQAAARQGLDAEEKPLAQVTYRPRPNKKKPTDYTILAYNNLTGSHYRTLTGPPLAPRRDESRIVANFKTANGRLNDGRWVALGAWEDYLTPGGVPFLGGHFTGAGNLPPRDLRGVRPRARREAVGQLREFVAAALGKP